jgi:hypothetical protein
LASGLVVGWTGKSLEIWQLEELAWVEKLEERGIRGGGWPWGSGCHESPDLYEIEDVESG